MTRNLGITRCWVLIAIMRMKMRLNSMVYVSNEQTPCSHLSSIKSLKSDRKSKKNKGKTNGYCSSTSNILEIIHDQMMKVLIIRKRSQHILRFHKCQPIVI